jgi:hypothetical protein
MKFRFLICLLFIFSFTYGQNLTFKVLVNKGKSEVKVGTAWQTIKVGSSLSKNDEIKVAPNSYVGLVHYPSGKPIELKEPGNYTITDLEKRVGTGTSVMAKYTDFILSSNSSPNNNLKATGAVHRGPQNINVYLPTVPSFKVVYGSHVIVNWDNQTIKGPYLVTLSNTFGDELKKTETIENSITINLDDQDFKGQDNISIKVFSKSEQKASLEQLGFRTMTKVEKEKTRKLIDAEVPGISTEETALSKLLMASFFEDKKLLIDAATAYQQAIKLAPDVNSYQEAYQAFLLRTSLKDSKEKK